MTEGLNESSVSQEEQHDKQTLLPIETMDQAIERLSTDLDLFPLGAAPLEDGLEVNYSGRKNHEEYEWTLHYRPVDPADATLVDPTRGSQDAEAFGSAERSVRGNREILRQVAKNEGRWWVPSNSEDFIEKKTREGIRIHDGENSVDLLNCSEVDLSDEEKASIEKVFSRVVNYTAGKILKRINGVVLLPGSEFPDGISGDFQIMAGVLRINMDSLHEEVKLGRFSKYFNDDQVSWFEMIMAHELGHTMDISTPSEGEAHGIDKDSYAWGFLAGLTKDFGAFDDKFGWTHSIEEEPNLDNETKKHKVTVHKLNDDMVVECGELAPTDYAKTHPREDFAESFAIASMGGDMSTLPGRNEVLRETVNKAQARAVTGPSLVTFEQITDQSQIIKPIRRVGIRAYISR